MTDVQQLLAESAENHRVMREVIHELTAEGRETYSGDVARRFCERTGRRLPTRRRVHSPEWALAAVILRKMLDAGELVRRNATGEEVGGRWARTYYRRAG